MFNFMNDSSSMIQTNKNQVRCSLKIYFKVHRIELQHTYIHTKLLIILNETIINFFSFYKTQNNLQTKKINFLKNIYLTIDKK